MLVCPRHQTFVNVQYCQEGVEVVKRLPEWLLRQTIKTQLAYIVVKYDTACRQAGGMADRRLQLAQARLQQVLWSLGMQ